MFHGAVAFAGSLSSWNVAQVELDAGNVSVYATAYNEDITSWTVSSVTNMRFMFQDAVSFGQNIGRFWDFMGFGSNAANFDPTFQMFEGGGVV